MKGLSSNRLSKKKQKNLLRNKLRAEIEVVIKEFKTTKSKSSREKLSKYFEEEPQARKLIRSHLKKMNRKRKKQLVKSNCGLDRDIYIKPGTKPLQGGAPGLGKKS